MMSTKTLARLFRDHLYFEIPDIQDQAACIKFKHESYFILTEPIKRAVQKQSCAGPA